MRYYKVGSVSATFGVWLIVVGSVGSLVMLCGEILLTLAAIL